MTLDSPVWTVLPQPAPMGVAQLGRDDERPELAPHHLFAGEAEHPLGGGVELADRPGVEDDHRVDGRTR